MKAKIITREIMSNVYEKNSYLFWAVDKNYNSLKHSLAGILDISKGYYRVTIDGESYLAHRILYQIYHNIILESDQQIDHINRIRTDNRKENLEISTPKQNARNRSTPKNNLSTGVKNITIKRNKFHEYYNIQIRYNDKKFSKYFRTDKFTIEEVIEIRNKMLLELHGCNASFG